MYQDLNLTRKLIAGVNWSPGIEVPFRRLGRSGEGLDAIMTDARVGGQHPIILVVHVACPTIQFLDRGKTSIVVEGDE
jgi:hypothetical protein